MKNNFQFSIDSLSREDYFAIPFDLHQIRDKHFRLFDEAHHADLTDLITFRVLLKELEVVKPAPKSDRITAKQAEVTETVVDLIERRMAQYHEAVELGRLFGGLPVSVTPHQVTNGVQHHIHTLLLLPRWEIHTPVSHHGSSRQIGQRERKRLIKPGATAPTHRESIT